MVKVKRILKIYKIYGKYLNDFGGKNRKLLFVAKKGRVSGGKISEALPAAEETS